MEQPVVTSYTLGAAEGVGLTGQVGQQACPTEQQAQHLQQPPSQSQHAQANRTVGIGAPKGS